MPELPEVEIVKQSLYKNIKSKKIKKQLLETEILDLKFTRISKN